MGMASKSNQITTGDRINNPMIDHQEEEGIQAEITHFLATGKEGYCYEYRGNEGQSTRDCCAD